MSQDFVIVGADYGVGKSYVTCAMLRDLRSRGFKAMGYKPICCGDRAEARAIRDVTEPSISLEVINPLYLRANADPYIAAELQRVIIEPQKLIDGYRLLKAAGYGPVIIDGIGGWRTPLTAREHMSTLARELGLPVVLVVQNRLGAAGLVDIVSRDMRQQGLDLRGVILNHMGEEWDTAAVTNRQLIEQVSGVRVLAELIHEQEDIDSAEVLGI